MANSCTARDRSGGSRRNRSPGWVWGRRFLWTGLPMLLANHVSQRLVLGLASSFQWRTGMLSLWRGDTAAVAEGVEEDGTLQAARFLQPV